MTDPALYQTIGGLNVVSLGNYEAWLKKLVLDNKHAAHKLVVRELARLIFAKTPSDWRGLPLVWIPGHSFEPIHLVEDLALELARLGQPLYPKRALGRKLGLRRAQKQLNLNERKQAKASERYTAFGKRTSEELQPVILLDDVITTGSTLVGCAQILEERLGLKAQGALSVAFTPLRREVVDSV